jgi:surface carbohydrate biosynthesis protein
MTASHLMRYSQRLHRLGVLVGVLPNEGIAYDYEDLKCLSGEFHGEAHIDHFFSWNQLQKQALTECGFGGNTKIHVIGVPRFDFYFEPWSKTIQEERSYRISGDGRPLVLMCTNFVYAKFQNTPADAEKFFSKWRCMEKYQNPTEFVGIHVRARDRFIEHVHALLDGGRHCLILRPHPLEDPQFYRQWWADLPEDKRSSVIIDRTSNIKNLILDCDVEVACENCTTTLESWIAGKPTVDLAFERNPSLFDQDLAKLNRICDDPQKIVETVEAALTKPLPGETSEGRAAHVTKWCDVQRGTSTGLMAKIIADAVLGRKEMLKSELTMADQRRGLKLSLLNTIGLPYHTDFLLPLKERLIQERYAMKAAAFRKSITPGDVAKAQRQLAESLTKATTAPV